MNLYDLKIELVAIEKKLEDWAMEHEGDVTEFPLMEALEGVEGDMEEKALSIGLWIKNLLAESKAIDVEKKALDARAKAGKAKAERLKNFLQDLIPSGTKYSDAKCVIGWRKSASVSVLVEPEFLPSEYVKTKIEADKTLIKAAIKEGKEIDFAEIVNKQSIQIK